MAFMEFNWEDGKKTGVNNTASIAPTKNVKAKKVFVRLSTGNCLVQFYKP